MAQKRYGPTLDAGVVVIEKDAEKSIGPAQLGSTAYVGILERGPVGELITATGKRDLLAKCGSFIPDSLLPDAAADFFDHSDGAGVLFLYRVTDGNEQKASLTAYDRKASRNAVSRWDAKNGGSWAGKRETFVVDLSAVPGDIPAENTVDLPIALHPIYKDQFKGGTLKSTETGNSYPITGNDASDGAAKTTLTLASDATLLTDFASGTDAEFTIETTSANEYGESKHLAIKFKDGVFKPSTEWGVEIYLDGALVYEQANLSSDPNDRNYFKEVINEDTSNLYVTVIDLWVGAVTAETRPANFFATVASADLADITAKGLDLSKHLVLVDSSLAGTNTIGSFTFGADAVADTYELELTASATWQLTSLTRQKTHTFTAPTDGVVYAADNPFSIGFTATAVSDVVGEKFTLTVLPPVADEAIGGKVFFPDQSFAPGDGWFISDNDETSITIQTGDMTNAAAISGDTPFRLEYAQQLSGGYDGIASIGVNDFLEAYDVNGSPFNQTVDQGYGLIKFATPGITELPGAISSGNATTIEKAGIAYAVAKNHQYRYEIPKSITDEVLARTHVNTTIGFSSFSKVIFPSFATVSDPMLNGRLKDVPLTGQVHGREAYVARTYDGYHKVAAGLDVTLPRIVRLPTGDKVLNGEILNPTGIQQVKLKGGNYIVWGARLPTDDPAFVYSQHRELLSYYEHVFMESFQFILFAINDKQEQPALIAAFKSFLIPEWRKRALRGDSFDEAARIKIDDENNTNATRSLGQLNAEITLRFADTVEQFIITIGKAGIFEDLAA